MIIKEKPRQHNAKTLCREFSFLHYGQLFDLPQSNFTTSTIAGKITDTKAQYVVKLNRKLQGESMKIVSWNCRYGFTPEKVQAIGVYDADILVIQECREKDWEQEKSKWPSNDFYCDRIDSDLGIAVFSKKYTVTRGSNFDKGSRYVIPYTITGTKEPRKGKKPYG
jgi:hypothetical protein